MMLITVCIHFRKKQSSRSTVPKIATYELLSLALSPWPPLCQLPCLWNSSISPTSHGCSCCEAVPVCWCSVSRLMIQTAVQIYICNPCVGQLYIFKLWEFEGALLSVSQQFLLLVCIFWLWFYIWFTNALKILFLKQNWQLDIVLFCLILKSST